LSPLGQHTRATLDRHACDRTPIRHLSARAPRQAVLRASFRLAPWVRHEALRPPSDQDARCVRPTSATRTNDVHPHLARSRQLTAAFATWVLARVWALASLTGEPNAFTCVRFASADRLEHENSDRRRDVLSPRRLYRAERGRFLPTVLSSDRASDIPVASLSSARGGPTFAGVRWSVRERPRPP
jgi:hypothetical protein